MIISNFPSVQVSCFLLMNIVPLLSRRSPATGPAHQGRTLEDLLPLLKSAVKAPFLSFHDLKFWDQPSGKLTIDPGSCWGWKTSETIKNW